ncbi:hypothetical protein BDR05DRAFT_954044 [Suillus weaverae]|nr:hypothetical protein BDR05DRAFT_954044 [Suillus weaverae]
MSKPPLCQGDRGSVRYYLQNLPETIPHADPSIPQYGFDFFALDDEKIEDYGPIGALNRELEVRMERGPGLDAVTNVLGGYLDQYHESPDGRDSTSRQMGGRPYHSSSCCIQICRHSRAKNNSPAIQLPSEFSTTKPTATTAKKTP